MGWKMKIYRSLTGATVRNFVRRAENFFALNLPTVHRKIFLPTKAAAKSALLKFSMARVKKSSRAVSLWKISARENFSPLVSVIVPNFNHENFLPQRLETIYNQTYKNFEVLLLDDCSTDGSRDVLKKFQAAHSDNTRLLFNEKNSGSVFAQWRRGLEAARGDLIWIAESDDFSAENFLAELVPAFSDDAIELAFCRTDFIQNDQKIFTSEKYLADLPDFDWQKNFAMTAAEFVARGFGVKNIIPNVSGVLFRKKIFPDACLDMKLCGDWLFYLDAILGGCVYYSPAATNFYRVHKKSTSLKIQKEPRYFIEHERIAEHVAENFFVPAAVHEAHRKNLEEHFFGYYGGSDLAELEKFFDVKKILRVKRKPNVLIGVFAFSIGGGETFPLTLANELRRRNFPVTVLNFQMADDLPDVRKKLKPEVPLVYLNNTGGLAEVVEQFKIDVIHTHHGAVDIAAGFVAENNPRLRHVVTLHGMYEAADPDYLKKILDRVKKSVDTFVYIADKNLTALGTRNEEQGTRFVKIGNGLERAPINPVPRAQLNIPEKSFVACVVSRAIPQKGWQAAVDAVKLANSSGGRRIDLILVGAGEMYDKLRGRVPEFVHLVGFRGNVRDYLAAADVGLLPSEYAGESFPLLIIDSFFAGRPVVSSNLGEVRAMVEDAGVVFDLVGGKIPIAELAKILRTLADDSELYEKLRSRVAVVAEKFFIERVAEKYVAVFEDKSP